MEITISQNENQLIELGNSNVQDIGINNNDNQVITLSNNLNNQDININQRDNQVIYIDGGGVSIGINDVLVNGVSVVSNNIAYVIVPTKTSQLVNDSGFITNETDPTVPSYVKTITLADINKWNNKQDLLVSGTNIKTINNTSLLGSGNIDIQSGGTYSAGTGIDITNNVISNTITSYNDLSNTPTIPTQTSDLINDNDFVSEEDLSEVAFTGSYASLSDIPEIPDATSDLTNDGDGTYPFLLNKSSGYIDGIGTLGGATAQARNLAYTWDNGVVQESHTVANYDDLTNELSTKQDTLVSGTNIKTINNESILGSGNINISGGGSTDVQINGTSIVSNNVADILTKSAYNSSTNKIITETDISNMAKTDIDNNFTTKQTIKAVELKDSQPHIDFHFNSDMSVDYTSRIIESSQGTLNIPGNLDISGNLTNKGKGLQTSLELSLETSGVTSGNSISYTPDGTSGMWLIFTQVWAGVNDNGGIYMINPITSGYTNVNAIINSPYVSITYSGGVITINKLGGASLNYKIIKVLTSYSS